MEAHETLQSFFWEKLGVALREHRVETAAETEHYLVQLLAAFATHPVDEEPLALKLLAAKEAPPTERRRQLREIGDTSLFVSGFWADSFARRVVDVDYYIGVGGSAYGQLAAGDGWGRDKDKLGKVFEELANKFGRFVSVLETLSHWVRPASSPQDIVKLYERYRMTGSSWAANKLAAMGVLLPDAGGKVQ
jgi:hypothetical protein